MKPRDPDGPMRIVDLTPTEALGLLAWWAEAYIDVMGGDEPTLSAEEAMDAVEEALATIAIELDLDPVQVRNGYLRACKKVIG